MRTIENLDLKIGPDPYAAITAALGKPYTIRHRHGRPEGGISFNKPWLARFIIEKNQLRHDRRDGLFRLGPTPSKVITGVQSIDVIAGDFRDYLQTFHPDNFPAVMAEFDQRMCEVVIRFILDIVR